MAKLPKLIASSVIRSAHQGESHGGVYLVDMESGAFDQVIDWNDSSIDWSGRGADRGLRGIAFHNNQIILAASDEIFIYDRHFNIIGSHRNKYLKHCHEIFVADDTLFITSTGFDSILIFNLSTKAFVCGYCIRFNPVENRLYFKTFDPRNSDGPEAGDTLHVNNVHYEKRQLFIGSLRMPVLFCVRDNKLSTYAKIPLGSHNARPLFGGVLLNDTVSNRILYSDKSGNILGAQPVIKYPNELLTMTHLPQDHARQAFARGLCVSKNGWIFGGSSPSTISAYRLDVQAARRTLNLTMDVRNSIHGLEIWPFK